MQQRSPALKRTLRRLKRTLHRRGRAIRIAVLVVGLGGVGGLTGCGAAWSGAWTGTADVGPVDAHALTLILSPSASTVQLALGDGDTPTLTVCAKQIEGAKLALEIDTGRPDCSPGQGARRLRLEGLIGARVIHGDIYHGHERIGFFRAFRATDEDEGLASTPTPTPTPAPTSHPPATPRG